MNGLPDDLPPARGSVVYLTLVVLVATLGGLLFGYDTAVIAGAIGFLQTHFDLTPAMKGFAASSALAGCVIGVILAGPISDRFGRRSTLVLAAITFFVSAIGTALPRTLMTFVVFRFLGGVGVGAASMTGPMYIAEISPARIRGRMVPCCTIPIEAECSFGLGSHHPIISLQGIPSSVIVFRILHPILASALCDANPLARIADLR